MKDPNDTSTIDALDAPRRGRPRKADALSNAERQKLWRQRQREKKAQAVTESVTDLWSHSFARHLTGRDIAALISALGDSVTIRAQSPLHDAEYLAELSDKLTRGTRFEGVEIRPDSSYVLVSMQNLKDEASRWRKAYFDLDKRVRDRGDC